MSRENQQKPSKRIYTIQSSSKAKEPLDIQSILTLSEDAIWALRKQDLRSYFITLHHYAQNPYPISIPTPSPPQTPTTTTTRPPNQLPPFLRLPLEIRQIIYTYTLPPIPEHPLLGPHPRQLQSPLHLAQPILPNLLLLNHQIHHESLPLLYGPPTQIIHIKIDYNLWTHTTTRSTLILSPLLISSFKNLEIGIHLGNEKKSLPSTSASTSNSSSSSTSSLLSTTSNPSTTTSSSSSPSKPKAQQKTNTEALARLSSIKKGIRKTTKWLSGAEIETLTISWSEPPQTFTWEDKKSVLEGLRGIGAKTVREGVINWGIEGWSKGKKYRFDGAWLRELERGWGGGGSSGGGGKE